MERIARLLDEMGCPHKNLRFIHIAGTNGKGSTAFMVSAILKQAGYRVGRFISPHIHSYRERFTINSSAIEAPLLLSYLKDIEDKIAALHQQGFSSPTEFEILTAVAMQYFNDQKVDVVVMEVGMGGVFDSTNVITPLVSVITGIDFDHTSFLGNSLQEIAANKAGIIKYKIPIVAAPMDSRAWQVIETRAFHEQAPLYPSSQVKIISKSRPGIYGRRLDLICRCWNVDDLFFPPLGKYQLQNLSISITVLMVLKEKGFKIGEEHIKTALSELKIPGRCEMIKSNPPVILDAAHNPQAASVLACSVGQLFPDKKKVLLCGVLDDKDAQNILKPLIYGTRAFIITKPAGNRSHDWRRIESICRWLCPGKDIYSEESIIRAVEKGLNITGSDELLLITGSYYVLDQARQFLTKG